MITSKPAVVFAGVAIAIATVGCPPPPTTSDKGLTGLEMRCRDGSKVACTQLIDIYENGEGVPRNPERAAKLRLYVDSLARPQSAQQQPVAKLPSVEDVRACKDKCRASFVDCAKKQQQEQPDTEAEGYYAKCNSGLAACDGRCGQEATEQGAQAAEEERSKGREDPTNAAAAHTARMKQVEKWPSVTYVELVQYLYDSMLVTIAARGNRPLDLLSFESVRSTCGASISLVGSSGFEAARTSRPVSTCLGYIHGVIGTENIEHSQGDLFRVAPDWRAQMKRARSESGMLCIDSCLKSRVNATRDHCAAVCTP